MIDLKNNHIPVERGNIYWYNFNGVVMPVMVIQNDIGNKHSMNTIFIKLSSSENVSKKYSKIPTIVRFSLQDIIFDTAPNGHMKDIGYALASDIYTVKKESLKHYIGKFRIGAIEKIDKALLISLNLYK